MTRVVHPTSATPLHLSPAAPASVHPRRLRARHAIAVMLLSLLGISATATLEEEHDATATVAAKDRAAR
jgi:hypothetical protein